MLLKENYKRKSEKSWSLWLLPLAFLSCFIFSTQSFAMTTEKDAKTVQDKGVTPESRKFPSLEQYFESLRNDENFVIDKADINEVIKILKAVNEPHLWKEWFSFKISTQYPELLKGLIEKGNNELLKWALLKSPYWLGKVSGGHTISNRSWQKVNGKTVSKTNWLGLGGGGVTTTQSYSFVEKKNATTKGIKADSDFFSWIVRDVLFQPHWLYHSEVVNALIEKGSQSTLQWIANDILFRPEGQNYPEFIEAIIERANKKTLGLVEKILSESDWKNHPRLLELTQGKEVNAENLKKALVEVNKNQTSCS